MSCSPRHRAIHRLIGPLSLVGACLLVAPSGALGATLPARSTGATVPGRAAAGAAPTQVIDAQADPKGAATALNAGCTDLSNCSWNGSQVTFNYGPSSIYGDVLYNCADPVASPDATASTAAGFSETRSESVSMSESVAVKISLGFLGFEKASAEFKATFGQSSSFSQGVTTTTTVPVPPGWKGWIENQVLSGMVSGNAYITDGINLIQVKNLSMSFPLDNPTGEDPGDARAPVKYNTFSMPMTAADYSVHCAPVNGLGAVRSQSPSRAFKLTVCRTGRCTVRKVTGPGSPGVLSGNVVLRANGRTVATGSDTKGKIRLKAARRLGNGQYTLRLSRSRQTGKGKRRSLTTSTTIIPIVLR